MLVGLCFGFAVIESGYRLFDPYPYFPPWEINKTKHANILEYDELLGWRGVSNAHEFFITRNAKFEVKHNRFGFRDVDPELRFHDKPSVVFLGDSFTWGYEVDFTEMFVNIVRRKIDQFEFFNLAHGGYGTDQALLSFRKWHDHRPVKLVILMFYENDISENNSKSPYRRYKPKYDLIDGELVLTNIPVPHQSTFDLYESVEYVSYAFDEKIKNLLFQSYFLHDISYRMFFPHRRRQYINYSKDSNLGKTEDLTLTKAIIQELQNESSKRGARLSIIAIPSKQELYKDSNYEPYQRQIQIICEQMGIDYLDLAPSLKKAAVRTYFREGIHWNKNGHKKAADTIYQYLREKGYL